MGRLNGAKSRVSSSFTRITLPVALSLLFIMASTIISPCLGFESTIHVFANIAKSGNRFNASTRSINRNTYISKRSCLCFARSASNARDNCNRRKEISSSCRPLNTQPRAIFHHPLHLHNSHHQHATNSISYPYFNLQRRATSSSASSSITENNNPPATIEEYEDEDLTEEGDTIFALSSGGGGASVGSGATAVAIIRISGPCAFDALRELMSPHPLSGVEAGGGESDDNDDNTIRLPKLPKARMASLRTLYDPLSDDNADKRDPLDSALVLTFPGPNSFTGEDIVELHCHGSRAVVQGVLSALSSLHSRRIPDRRRSRSMALRPADPGEFTQRAYAHGKLGLVEVEALADLIVADTSLQRKQALQQFDGRLSRLYMGWRKELIKGLAHAEAVIDFGDDEVLDDDEDDGSMDADDGGMSIWGTIPPRMTSLRLSMERHLSDASRGELLRDGLRVAIVGRPNAGKSSLLNLLAGRDAAIVSSAPGTTRDVVEVMLDLGGVRCTLLDTAGVREEGEEGVNDIEVEGMRRARRAARDAHIVVGVVDASVGGEEGDRGLEAVEDLLVRNGEEDEFSEDEEGGSSAGRSEGNVLYVLNKLDLVEGIDKNASPSIRKLSEESSSFGISCTTSEGVDAFLSSLTERALSMVSDSNNDSANDNSPAPLASSVEGTEGAVITRARHRRHVEAASEALERFEALSGGGYMALDLAAEELRLAASELGRVTGAIDVENILDVLFADFCIGK